MTDVNPAAARPSLWDSIREDLAPEPGRLVLPCGSGSQPC